MVERTGPALGLGPDAEYEEQVVQLDIGDRLLLYTDGVLGEAESYSVDDLATTLTSGISRAQVPGTLFKTATQAASGDRDDITIILLERGEGASRFDDTPAPEERQPTQQSSPQPLLLQGVSDDRAFICISGTATWTCSQAFLEGANTLLTQYRRLTFDLGACEYLDSTCLGTLHEVVTANPEAVTLQQLPDNIRNMFQELSMQAVLDHTREEPIPLPDKLEPIQGREVDPAQQGARMLSAHETLAALSPENREVFQGVVDSLRADLDS